MDTLLKTLLADGAAPFHTRLRMLTLCRNCRKND